MSKSIYYMLLPLAISLWSCSDSKSNEAKKTETAEELLLSDLEEQELLIDSINWENGRYHYPDIISNSAPNLKLVKNKWNVEAILCSETETFKLLRKVSDERFIAISAMEKGDQSIFHFYDFTISGEILHKSILPNADYGIGGRHNLKVEGDLVYYYTTEKTQNTYSYNLSTSLHSSSSNDNLDWQNIQAWSIETRYKSYDERTEILLSNVQLVALVEGEQADTLINQKYDGTWSFRLATWSSDNAKFYFDNSGSVACIWELNLEKRTLDKIVSDHWARSPVYVNNGSDAILYCNEKCIYLTTKAIES